MFAKSRASLFWRSDSSILGATVSRHLLKTALASPGNLFDSLRYPSDATTRHDLPMRGYMVISIAHEANAKHIVLSIVCFEGENNILLPAIPGKSDILIRIYIPHIVIFRRMCCKIFVRRQNFSHLIIHRNDKLCHIDRVDSAGLLPASLTRGFRDAATFGAGRLNARIGPLPAHWH